MQESQLIRSATFAGRGRCRRRRLGLALGTAVVLLLACAQTALAAPETLIDSGPPPSTNSTSATFTFSSDSSDPTLAFACELDGGGFQACTSPQSYDALADGPHTFSVQATDATGTDLTPATYGWTVDATAPETAIDSGPSGTITTNSVTFTFSSNEPNATFECTLDGTSEPCTSSTSYGGLAAGTHTFSVRATDGAGNVDPTEASVSFTIDLGGSPPAVEPPAPVATSNVAARPAASFVLIAGRAVKVNRNRSVAVTLNCSGTKDCAGRVVLTTASGIRFHRRRLVMRLGSARFSIRAPLTAKVKIRLSKSKYRLLKRLRSVRALVTVTDVDTAGRARISTREIRLRV